MAANTSPLEVMAVRARSNSYLHEGDHFREEMARLAGNFSDGLLFAQNTC
jgi:hypothetical protein